MKYPAFLFLLILGALITFQKTAAADGVYKWEDDAGVVHYQTKPMTKDSKPAELPQIMRGDVKLAKENMTTCQPHGGVNCQAGTDDDGSVICYDGFKGAVTRFRFACNSPKLEIADISDLTQDGSFSVFVRNSKSVAAANASVTYKRENEKEIKLEGPSSIEAFGSAEFKFNPQNAQNPITAKPTVAEITVACANCPS